ncbi:glutathione S-transferase [Stella humosa]|uniref:Glutathione S-transferase n=1 Tax=Stella humosa TaxID=94 RepID=A0A3N1LYL1_9PROT|nr:glutathione S-transferase family protein [Stella humosa]ROQ00314.1 glutathione S-transferase [Stella humosa]BBK30448.1 glutathione S-transferase [Stella humosa]
MKLYYAETLMPRKACAVARHLGSPVEFVRVDLGRGEHKKPGYLAINPAGRVPALVDGDYRLSESNAVMAYLALRAGSDLWPADARQVEVIRWLSWDSEHFTRHGGSLYFEHVIRPLFDLGPADAEGVRAATSSFRQSAVILEAHLGARDWLVGDGPTIADFAVAIALPYAEASRIPLDAFPAIGRWHDRMNGLEGWRQPFPSEAA